MKASRRVIKIASIFNFLMVNTTAFKDYSRKQLIAILDSVRGRKSLILDSSLSGPLSIIAEFSLLKEHGVDKVFLLQNHSLDPDSKSIIYLIRPKIQFLKLIAAQIKQHKSLNFFIFFVPVRSVVCDIFLEDQGVLGDVVLGEYHFDLVPLDQDVLSLEIEDSFKHLALDGDTSVIYNLAKSIMKIQTIYGIIPKIAGKGENAKLLSHILVRMRRELVANLDDPAAQSRVFPLNSEIESMVIIDRSIDLITPMCYQLTYEGLIDEQFGIKSSIHPFNVAFVDLDNSIIGGPTPPQNPSASQLKTRKVPLNSTDKLYQKLRGMNFAIVSGSLNQVAKKLADDYQGRHQAKTISQIKDFVGKLSDIQAEHSSLRLHVNLCEQVSKYTSEIDFNKILEIQQSFFI